VTDDLASQPQRVDRASHFEVVLSCLTLIDSHPLSAECKRKSYDLFNATQGRRRERHREVAGLSFDVARRGLLPFDDASFDACRIDRVLPRIVDPAQAIAETVRVLRRGGVPPIVR
jgi:SAM-dependent methyltransferase